jgi:hypothetical protein
MLMVVQVRGGGCSVSSLLLMAAWDSATSSVFLDSFSVGFIVVDINITLLDIVFVSFSSHV